MRPTATDYSKYMGSVYGDWKIVSLTKKNNRFQFAKVICKCGLKTERPISSQGEIKSSRCAPCNAALMRERKKKLGRASPNKTHGFSKTPVYESWCKMKQRCKDKDHHAYQYYGGRGISYDHRWDSFQNFIDDMGVPERGMTIDRIDVNGNYSKENCKWSTRKEQAQNRRKRGTGEYLKKRGVKHE